MMQINDKPEKRLRALFSKLSEGDRETLLAFAEFLAARCEASQPSADPVPEPQLIPRPERESVIGAVKRLSASYPMLDKSKMLHETSSLVTQHLVQGRASAEVINELEVVFEQHYRGLVQRREEETPCGK